MGVARWWLGPCAALAVAGWGGNQFTPLVILYREQAGHSDVVITAVFGAYVLGLVPGFLLGGEFSDRRGRRIVWWALLISAAVQRGPRRRRDVRAVAVPRADPRRAVPRRDDVGRHELGEGAVPAVGDRRRAPGVHRAHARLHGRAAVRRVLAQWGPWPLVTPYVVHVVLSVATALAVRAVPETVVASRRADAPRGGSSPATSVHCGCSYSRRRRGSSVGSPSRS